MLEINILTASAFYVSKWKHELIFTVTYDNDGILPQNALRNDCTVSLMFTVVALGPVTC